MKHRCLFLAAGAALIGCGHHVAPQAPTWLEPKVDTEAKQGAPDAARVGDFYRGVAYDDGDRTDWHVPLDAANCYYIAGAGDEQVRKLYLFLWDEKDKRVADYKEDTSSPMMHYCPERSGMFRVQAKVDEGRGHFRVGIYSKAAPPKAAPPPPPPPPSAPDLAKMIDAEAAAAAPGASRVGELFAGRADKSDWYTALEAGNCYWFVGVGGTGVKKLYLYLWDQGNHRIGDNRADAPKAVLGHCATQSGMYHIQAKVESGSGEYKLGVFAKKQ